MTEHFTGTSVDLSHLADPNPYSSTIGTIEFQGIQADPPETIPWWKFDSVDGSLVPVLT